MLDSSDSEEEEEEEGILDEVFICEFSIFRGLMIKEVIDSGFIKLLIEEFL